MIPQHTVQEIIEAAHIEEVVGTFVELRKRGVNMIGLCPFHDEKTPSFTVSPSKNIYKCFGCGEGGDSVSFLMDKEQMTYPDALRFLAQMYNIPIEERPLTESEKLDKDNMDSLYGLMDYANTYYKDSLVKTKEGQDIALSYFKERGLLQHTIETFQLGYAPRQTGLVDKLERMGYKEELISAAGLSNKRGGDFFYDRVMFPIQSLSGKVVAFAGRTLKKDKGPKYINSPETKIYVKNKVLYGLYQAKTAIKKENNCYLVEGYMDVISLHQNGVPNVVASSGTSLTTGQAKLIKRFSENICLLYDGDQAGINATIRGVEILLKADLNVKICILPDGQDPDSYIRAHGLQRFQSYVDTNSKDFVLFLADLRLKEHANDPIKRADYVKEILALVASIDDNIKRAAYIQELAITAQMDEQVINAELGKLLKSNQWKAHSKAIKEAEQQRNAEVIPEVGTTAVDSSRTSQDSIYYKERDLLRVLIDGGTQFVKEIEMPVAEYIMHELRDIPALNFPLHQRVFDMIKEQMAGANELKRAYFLHHEDEEIKSFCIDLIQSPYAMSENWAKKYDIRLETQVPPEENFYKDSIQAILKYKLDTVNKQIEANIEELDAASDEEEIDLLLQVQQQLLNWRQQVSERLNTIVMSS